MRCVIAVLLASISFRPPPAHGAVQNDFPRGYLHEHLEFFFHRDCVGKGVGVRSAELFGELQHCRFCRVLAASKLPVLRHGINPTRESRAELSSDETAGTSRR